MVSIFDFQTSIPQYEKSMGVNAKRGLFGSAPRKVQWAFMAADYLNKFRQSLAVQQSWYLEGDLDVVPCCGVITETTIHGRAGHSKERVVVIELPSIAFSNELKTVLLLWKSYRSNQQLIKRAIFFKTPLPGHAVFTQRNSIITGLAYKFLALQGLTYIYVEGRDEHRTACHSHICEWLRFSLMWMMPTPLGAVGEAQTKMSFSWLLVAADMIPSPVFMTVYAKARMSSSFFLGVFFITNLIHVELMHDINVIPASFFCQRS